MPFLRSLAIGAVALAAVLPSAEAGGKSHKAKKPQLPPHTAQHDGAVAAAWGERLYATIRDEKLNPPMASRLIGYVGVGMYESVVGGMPKHRSLGGQLHGFDWSPAWFARGFKLDWSLAANAATPRILKGLVPTASAASVAAIDALEAEQAALLRTEHGTSTKLAALSEAFGRWVAEEILAWAAGDGLATVLTTPYTPPMGPGMWVPTPPAFQAAPLLPAWGQLRPFAMASGAGAAPPPPPSYSDDPSSAFYAAALEVYETVNANTPETMAIAKFWADAGPGTGTPPGHWVSILTQIVRTRDLGLDVAAEALAKLGISQADAFICCWSAKYDWNVLRPVTYIQAHIDAAWLPPIGTPPFPSYTSGHSTQSGAAAVVLHDVLGDVPFTDDTHAALGLPARSFTSFDEAAAEAALSRLYGGIHYRFDNDAGLEVGEEIGRNVLTAIAWRVGRGHGRCGCR
jgi:hypothetical protein